MRGLGGFGLESFGTECEKLVSSFELDNEILRLAEDILACEEVMCFVGWLLACFSQSVSQSSIFAHHISVYSARL